MSSHPPTPTSTLDENGSSHNHNHNQGEAQSSGDSLENQTPTSSHQASQSESEAAPTSDSADATALGDVDVNGNGDIDIDQPPNLNTESLLRTSPEAEAEPPAQTPATATEPVPPRTVTTAEQPESQNQNQQPRRRFILTRRVTNSGTAVQASSAGADTTAPASVAVAVAATTATATRPTATAATTTTARPELNAEALALQAQWSRALSGLRNGQASAFRATAATTTTNANANANTNANSNTTATATATGSTRDNGAAGLTLHDMDMLVNGERNTDNPNNDANNNTNTNNNTTNSTPATSTSTTRIRMRFPPGARLSGRRIIRMDQPQRVRARVVPNSNNDNPNNLNPNNPSNSTRTSHPGAAHMRATAAAVNGTGTGIGIGIGIGGSATTAATADQGPFLAYSVNVPPLTGRVLADSKQQLVEPENAAQAKQTEQDLERFLCPICFEFLKDPAGCGQCSTRFCYECLSKVLTQRRQATAQCPICRQTLQAIQRDEELQRELEHAASIPCRYRDCNELLRLAQVAEHEVVCCRVCIACPYAEYGCQWKGTRVDCETHERTECAFGRVSTLVQDVRSMRADYGNRFRNVVHRLRAVDGLVEAHVQLVRANNARKSPSNPLDLMAFCIAITCTTPYFLWTKSRWTCMYASFEARACVYNTLSIFPTLLVALKFVVAGYQEIVATLTTASSSATAMTESEQENLIDLSLLTLILCLLGILVPVCLHVDSRSSLRWQFLAIPRVGERQVMMNIVAVSLAMIHGLIYEITGGKLNSVLICLWVEISSILMPAIVARTSLAATREVPRTERPNVLTTGRTSRPLLFGLRYGFIVARLGLMPSLDAALLLQVLEKRLLPVPVDLAFENEILLSGIPESQCLQFLGVRLVVKAHEWFRHGTLSADSLLAVITLLAFNFFFNRLASLGAAIGDVLAETAKVELIPTGRGVLKDYSGIGVAAFGFWAFINLLVLMS
jgi:hypothetical protein